MSISRCAAAVVVVKRFFSRPVALASMALTLGSVAVIRVTPVSQDFGEAGVNGVAVRTFRISAPPGADSTADLDLSITGANPDDFIANPTTDASQTCYGAFLPGWRAGPCDIPVHFMPKSIGIKTATLVVTDTRGNRGTAALRGKGVAPICEFKVVSCNYSHLYTGVVRWNTVIRGQYASSTQAVQVDIVLGKASCNGSQTDTDLRSGRSRRGDVQGDGLIGVEFLKDDDGKDVYNITVACPSPAFGAVDDAPAVPSQPAEIGGFYQQSYEQPATSVGMNLEGSTSYQDGAADPDNGVEGTVTMSWRLIRS